MNTVQRVAKNTVVLIISQLASSIMGFFFIAYTARHLGAEGFGILSFALAFNGIFAVFSDFGLSTLTVREVSRHKPCAGKYLGNITAMKLFLVIITFGLIALIINLLGYPKQTITVVYLIFIYVILSSFRQMFNSIFQAYEKMEYVSIGGILNSALMLIGAYYAISQAYGVIGFAVIYLIVSAIVLGYSLFVCMWKFTLLKIELDLRFWNSTIKKSLPFFLSAIFSVIAFRIDIVMLSLMKGDIPVGWYSAAYRLIEVFMFIPATFVGSLYPVLSIYYLSSQESLRIAYQKSFKYLSVAGLPIAVGTMLLAENIIMLIYNIDFSHSIIALQILVWTTPIIFLTYMFGTMLASIDRQDLTFKILLLCMILNVVINLILIPKFSYVGASVATVITELLAFILCYYFLSKFIYKIPIYKFIAKPVIACTVMGLLILYLVELNFFLVVFLSITSYLSVLILLRMFTIEDFKLFKQIFGKKLGEGSK